MKYRINQRQQKSRRTLALLGLNKYRQPRKHRFYIGLAGLTGMERRNVRMRLVSLERSLSGLTARGTPRRAWTRPRGIQIKTVKIGDAGKFEFHLVISQAKQPWKRKAINTLQVKLKGCTKRTFRFKRGDRQSAETAVKRAKEYCNE